MCSIHITSNQYRMKIFTTSLVLGFFFLTSALSAQAKVYLTRGKISDVTPLGQNEKGKQRDLLA